MHLLFGSLRCSCWLRRHRIDAESSIQAVTVCWKCIDSATYQVANYEWSFFTKKRLSKMAMSPQRLNLSFQTKRACCFGDINERQSPHLVRPTTILALVSFYHWRAAMWAKLSVELYGEHIDSIRSIASLPKATDVWLLIWFRRCVFLPRIDYLTSFPLQLYFLSFTNLNSHDAAVVLCSEPGRWHEPMAIHDC